MPNEDHTQRMKSLMAMIDSPLVLSEIDKVLEIYDEQREELMELRKWAVRRHGEGVSSSAESSLSRAVASASRMLTQPPTAPPSEGFDGTVGSLITSYRTDKDSPYQQLRYQSRKTYDYMLKYIEQDIGHERIADLDGRRLKEIHAHWAQRGVAMAHGIIGQLRGLATFGAGILSSEECLKLKTTLSQLKFEQAKPRKEKMTREMAETFIKRAESQGQHSMALAQALQFEAQLRQKDVIGEWVPEDEPGPPSEVMWRDMKWVRGIRWEAIDDNLVLRHVTSLGENDVEVSLADKPFVKAALDRIISDRGERPKQGPLVVSENTGRPYSVTHFRQLWRQIATDAGIPEKIKNSDSIEKTDWYRARIKTGRPSATQKRAK